MKTQILATLSAFFIFSSAALANHEEEKGKKKEATTTQTNTSRKIVVESFNTTLSEDKNRLNVLLEGSFDEYTSISLTTTRGSEVYFAFVQNGINEFSFDLSDLEKGTYYVVLNQKEEVRIRRFSK